MIENKEQMVAETGADSPQVEKMLSQSQVNDLIGRAKAEAQEKARSQANSEFQKKLEDLEAQKRVAQAHGNDTQEINAETLYQQVHERFQREAQQREVENFAREVEATHNNHLAAGAKQYEDFSDVTKHFSAAEFPEVVALLSGIEGGENVLYDLAKHPQKLASIDSLAKSSPQYAQNELRKMSSSIAANKQAANDEAQSSTQAPLDRMQSSNNAGNSGEMSVSDYKRQPWLRG